MKPWVWAWCVVIALVSVAHVHARTSSAQKALLKRAYDSPDGLLELDESSYQVLLSTPRDYAVFVVLTATDAKFQCTACVMVEEPVRSLARGWRLQKNRDQLVFAKIEARVAINLFRSAASEGRALPPVDFDVAQKGYDARDLAAFIFKETGINVSPKKKWITKQSLMLVGASVLALGFFGFMATQIRVDFGPRGIAMVISVGLIFTFTSGYMWNTISHPPYLLRNSDGSPKFVAPTFRSQYGVESTILISLYAGVMLSVLLLTHIAPKLANPSAQRGAVMVGLVALIGLVSALVRLFDIKSPGYPYRLFL